MRNVTKWMLVVGLAAVMAGPALAQGQGKGRGQGKGGQGRGGRGMGGFGFNQFLLANTSVQEEVKVTDEQKEKVREFATKEREEMMSRFQGGDRPTPEQMAENNKKTAEARDKFAKETLKADQYKRYTEIRLQDAGVMAFADDKVVSELKLTGEQKDKLKSLGEDYTKDRMELMQSARGGGGNPQELGQKQTKLKQEFATKAEGVLTSEQKAKWKELTGKPFEVRQEFGGGRGRRGQDKDK